MITRTSVHAHRVRLPDCDFVESSKNLYLHFSSKHSNSAISFDYDTCITIYLDKQRRYFVLQEKEEGTLFILNNWVELHGNLINLICIGESATIGFSYDLQVNNRVSSVILKSFTEFVPAWVEHSPLKRFLVVPSDFAGSCGMLTVELCIRR
ncbi:hypothetical protein Vadar_017476 [Vaccinium darrowii]|uniref:Uncharacterized protein n=1 Tax=Vaccinium darrowii TaxID=229202 RepID=A0ACB7YE35_9ERIC|nr:hypothetical protein Vadar_017476 [Vaccinium darrowii]